MSHEHDDSLPLIVRERFKYRRAEIVRAIEAAIETVARRALRHDGDIDAADPEWARLLDTVIEHADRLRAFDEAETRAAELAAEEDGP